ncbi:MAG: hypothetical protein R3D98_10680 [Candidatus Krumholzibacteriia bacterium]
MRACGVTFSSQTSSTTYGLKRPDILLQLPTKVTSGLQQSDRPRSGCLAGHHRPPDLPTRQARDPLPLQNDAGLPALEDVAVDGFVSFEHSQYHPFHFHVAVHRPSSFFIHFTDSEVRRSGTMTDKQKRQRAVLERIRGRPDPQAVRKDMQELLEYVTRGASAMTIHSDDHKAYPRAIRNLRCQIRHLVTSSKDIRNRINKLFEINLLDLLIRHCEAEHKRETIAYAKRRNCAAYKLAIFLVLRNYVKTRRVRKSRQTPAQLLGVCPRRLTVDEVLARRLFVDQVGLEGRWRQYYWQEVVTRALKINRRHELRFAV